MIITMQVDHQHDEPMVSYGSLEIEESLKDQERLWKIQNYGRSFLLLCVLVALSGFLGDGRFSRTKLESRFVDVTFQKIGYQYAPQTYKIELRNLSAHSGRPTLRIENEALEYVEIQEIVPLPAHTKLEDSHTTFEFEAPGASGKRLILVTLQPKEWGRFKTKLGIGDVDSLEIDQYFLP